MKKRLIVLLRHAQTMLSSGKRLIGQCDVELSKEGIENSKELGEALKLYGFKHVFSSALMRSKQTAGLVSGLTGTAITIEPGLNEISLGAWDGLFVEDIKKEYPAEYVQRGQNMISYRPPGGENFEDLQKRVLETFSKLLGYDGQLLIVAHASVNKVILANAMKLPLYNISEIKQDYLCCNVISQTGEDLELKLINGNAMDLTNILLEKNI